MQQALVGPGPNQLVLSYLKHSLSSQVNLSSILQYFYFVDSNDNITHTELILQLVSYAAVLQRISKYDAFHKPHCIVSLLEFLESIQIGITCRGKQEEDFLATAVLSIVHWLLQCYLHTLSKISHSNSLASHPSELMDKPAIILEEILDSDFLRAMMYLAKYDDKGML